MREGRAGSDTTRSIASFERRLVAMRRALIL
jgi:hypothetical protein